MNTSHVDGAVVRSFMNELETPKELRAPVIDIIALLRRRDTFDLTQVARALLQRIRDHKLESQDVLLRLYRLLDVARSEEISEFLANDQMTLDALEQQVRSRKFREDLTSVADIMETRLATGVAFTPADRNSLGKLRKLLSTLPLDNEET